MKNKYEGKKWGEIPVEVREQLLREAVCLDTAHSCIASEGACLIELEETLAVLGELINGEIIIGENAELYNPILGDINDSMFSECDEEIFVKIEKYTKRRPHVVLLGAGASIAALPNGDKYGRKISAMAGFIQKLGMDDILDGINLNTKSDNLEDIYMEIYERGDCTKARLDLEEKIFQYFNSFMIPDEPTVYDYLVLSLTKKDLIATFNWDPLIVQAYLRCAKITNNLPQLAFLHGNVAIGFCDNCNIMGKPHMLCSHCEKPLIPVKLLYPIKNKDYTSINAIEKSWNLLKNTLEKAYMVTIFGYSAPKSDVAAINMLKQAWGNVADRNFEEIEIIDIRAEDDVVQSWTDFIHTHHYSVHNSFFKSTLSYCPRRSCEATFDRLMNCKWLQPGKGYNDSMNFNDIKTLLKNLIKEEKQKPEILTNPYIAD